MNAKSLFATRRLAPALLALGIVLAGCGDEDPLDAGGSTPGGGTGGGTETDVEMGSGTGTAFVEGVIAVGIGTGTLSSGGSTSLTVTFIDQDDNLYDDEEITVTFSSTCIASGTATAPSVTTSTGFASTTYTSVGCGGTGTANVVDNVVASATANGQTLTANGSVTNAPSVLGSIAFVSATPSNIGLQGTGGTGRSETSVVVFRVLDSGGATMSGQTVSFALNTTVGGIQITPTSATTDTNGLAQTIVQAGTVAAPVRVTASATQGAVTIQTQSDNLTITTGVPDQDSMSLSATKLNPEALDYDGEIVTLTIRLADRFNNPVPDNTAVTFTTEGGSIVGNCATTDGACTVDWTSQNPRPADGRVTVIATAIGEESFNDVDGDGVFDNASDTFTDLPEAFRDDDEDGVRDTTEPFVDFDVSGDYTDVDSLWNGLLCQHATLCSTTTSVTVRASLVLTMSDDAPDLTQFPAACGSTLGVGPLAATFNVVDVNGNPLPAGTTVEFDMDDGDTLGPTSYVIGSTNSAGGTFHSINIVPDTTVGDGLLTVTVTTPKGTETTCSYTINGV